MKKVGAVKYT